MHSPTLFYKSDSDPLGNRVKATFFDHDCTNKNNPISDWSLNFVGEKPIGWLMCLKRLLFVPTSWWMVFLCLWFQSTVENFLFLLRLQSKCQLSDFRPKYLHDLEFGLTLNSCVDNIFKRAESICVQEHVQLFPPKEIQKATLFKEFFGVAYSFISSEFYVKS